MVAMWLVILTSITNTPAELPDAIIKVAINAEQKYAEKAIETTAQLLRFPTVKQEGLANRDNPHFQGMSVYLGTVARQLDFSYEDHGDVVVISVGSGTERLGLITHGDVVPADATKWKKDPFQLDRDSEPGKLIGRGVEDDKGPIALALFAMKALAESGLKINKKIELIISYTEESDWEPFRTFLTNVTPPPVNIALDANYPVTVAEKGWSGVWIGFSTPKSIGSQSPRIVQFQGGAFLSQVPEEASATLKDVDRKRYKKLRKRVKRLSKAHFEFNKEGNTLVITAKGKSAHSSTPGSGINALSHLAYLLGHYEWAPSAESEAIAFIYQNIGLDFEAKLFGKLAFSHPFMGPATLNLGTVEKKDGHLVVGINIRSPAGKSAVQIENEIRDMVRDWSVNHPSTSILRMSVSEAHLPTNPPHVPILLNVFSHFSGAKNPQPISIGGGTHARLVPNGVNFGPAMPNTKYTGHSENEFMTEQQFRLNLRMYTAMLASLATQEGKNYSR